MGTDRDWEKWGRDDPYFGVLSLESFRSERMSEDDRAEFFRSGEEHIENLLRIIRARFQPDFEPGESLDFGCGVGRLLIPLAHRSHHALGADISPSMLAEARRNCDRLQVGNVDLIESDDQLSRASGAYDLVHSHIVFAHIDPRRGHAIFEALAGKVSLGGFMAAQVLYACNAPRWARTLVKLRYRLPLLNAMRNLLRGRPWREPAMQLHIYNLATLSRSLNRLGFGEALLVTDRFDNGLFDSVVLIARRNAVESTT
jgi:SAM-dependent methyltransferase